MLTDTDRKYIVQTLATMLMTHIQRPTLQHCGVVAKALVTMYPFLGDDEGDGEVQHICRITAKYLIHFTAELLEMVHLLPLPEC